MKQNKLKLRCTEDYAVLYWDKPAAAPKGAEYTVSLNGEVIGRTDKTHFTIEGLPYGSTYRLEVASGSYCVGVETLQFGKRKRRVNVTAAPYFCKGDGKTLNTDNLQRAINDCRADDILYFPAGDYLTGALQLHSDLEIYLSRGLFCRARPTSTTIRPASPAALKEWRCAAIPACSTPGGLTTRKARAAITSSCAAKGHHLRRRAGAGKEKLSRTSAPASRAFGR